MAFVCEAQRALHYYNKSTQNIGPGYYQTVDIEKLNKTINCCAPFNSSTLKRSIYDGQKILQSISTQKIGPGYYDIENSFVKSNVKTYTNNNSIIVKINAFESPQFKSVIPRFKSLENYAPGPGEYMQDVRMSTITEETRKRSIEKRKKMKEKLYQFVNELKKDNKIPSQPSIPSKSYNLDKRSHSLKENQKSQKKPNPSISEYSHTDQNQNSVQNLKKLKGFTWAKTQRKFPTDIKKNSLQRNIGPGKYYTTLNNDPNQNIQKILPQTNKFMRKRAQTESSTFKTKYVRTFFDELCYQTNSKEVANFRTQENYKTDKPGPGYYNIGEGSKQKAGKGKRNVAYQFFGSTVERFPSQSNQEFFMDKGELFSFYDKSKSFRKQQDSSSIGKQKSFNKKQNAFLATEDRKNQFHKDSDDIPGPGEYQVSHIKSLFKLKKGKIVQNFGYSKERFPDKILQNLKKNVQQRQQEKMILRKKPQQQSFMFKSKIKKEPYQIKSQQDQAFGKYDITKSDLGAKINKQKAYLQNLRRIEVQIPGFNSGIQRFSYQKDSKSLQNSSNIAESIQKIKQKKLVINASNQKLRDKLIEKNKQQVIKSKKSTIYNEDAKLDRFGNLQVRDKMRNPGVGEYSLRSNWTKQSYNVKYHKNSINVQSSTLNSFAVQQNGEDEE